MSYSQASIQIRAKAELEKRKRAGVDSSFRTFQKKYRDDWVALIHDCFNWKEGEAPTAYQDEIIADLQHYKRQAVRGPHTLGKTALASWVILAFSLTRDGEDWKIPTTASSWRQLTKYLWPEVHKWARKLKWEVIGRSPFNTRTELMTRSLKLSTGEAFAMASNQHWLLEGAHADQMLVIFDEAKAIPDPTWDAVEGAFAGAGEDTTQEAFALSISTPGPPNGRFYDIHRRAPGYEDWHVRHVTKEEAISAGRMSRQWAEQRAKQWGPESAVYLNRVEGKFASSAEDVVIPLNLVERANELWQTWKEAGFPGKFKCLGVDVGRGGDPSVLALRLDDIPRLKIPQGDDASISIQIDTGIMELRHYTTRNTMAVAGIAKGILDKYGGYAVVDDVGVGAGGFDRLREQGKRVRSFSAGMATTHKDKAGELGFVDKRSAAWWMMRELLEEGRTALPPDDKLTGDLTAPKWETRSGGKIKVESKEELRKPERLGRSTNDADATIQAYWEEPTGWSARY